MKTLTTHLYSDTPRPLCCDWAVNRCSEESAQLLTNQRTKRRGRPENRWEESVERWWYRRSEHPPLSLVPPRSEWHAGVRKRGWMQHGQLWETFWELLFSERVEPWCLSLFSGSFSNLILPKLLVFVLLLYEGGNFCIVNSEKEVRMKLPSRAHEDHPNDEQAPTLFEWTLTFHDISGGWR